ncbi:hypothetical protein H6G33_28350 [Calothrix sp. FACHB-1219]|uniref:hypothetical protein n=1 Tax=unclassified Calothrix TaxID=2619626 RepID=UPI0016894C17|nr:MULTISPECIES: hypothetical protein [unclassified Calothrix]MBD2206121.1 hypothetical protein [Calothrix sp. FACHB-168]MBD2220891.1 hypothetical protein [Calothrix sp. FACHB-1219]
MQPLQLVSAADLQAFLDTPEQLLQQPTELQLAVANYIETPRSLLEILVNSTDKQVSQAASLHVNYAGEITENWQKAVDEILQQQELGQNDRLAVELLKLGTVPPCFFSEWVPAEKLIPGLRNPHIPLKYRLQLLERLAQEPTLEPRLQVAESPETPLAVLEQLAGDLELPIRLAVKFNPSCPPSLIELVEGQYTVASDWNTDAEQLAMLAQSRWAWIRLAVAQNPCATAETFMQLAGDRVYKIQLAVAKNPETPAPVLAVLAQYQNQTIEATVAEHLNATEEILHQLFPTQQQLLKRRENLPTSILERLFNEGVRDNYLFLQQPHTPTWILAELANVDLEALRVAKRAKHTHLPLPEVFEQWIRDDMRFLVDVAKHPQVSLEILEHLIQYPHPYIKLAIAQNSLIDPAKKIELLEDLVKAGERDVLKLIAADLQTPVAILEQIVEQESPQNKFRFKLRRLLTRNPEADNRESVADFCMDAIRKILAPYQISIDVEEWFNLIESYQWTTLLENYTYVGDLQGRYRQDKSFYEQVNEEWKQFLPTISESERQKIINNILEIPDTLVDVVKDDRTVAVALVGNPSLPVPLREKLQKQLTRPLEKLNSYENDCDMRMALAYNPQVPEAERKEYFQQLLSTNWNDIQETIARNPNTPTEIINQLMTRPGVGRQAVSRNPNAPASALAELAQDTNSATRNWVAENPGTPINILLQLAKQPLEKTSNNVANIRGNIIKNPHLSARERHRILLAIAEEQEITEAHQLMARRADSPYALAQVLEKGDRNSKITAARSHKTPIQVLQQLAKDADETVRSVVSENANLPLSNLLELTQDSSLNVRAGLARKRLHKPTAVEVLQHLANDESAQIRAQVAANTDTPEELLRKLANDSNKEVWEALARNPNTPVDILEFLGVEKGVVNPWNGKTPAKALAKAVENTLKMDFRFRDKALDELLKPRNSEMPAEILVKLANYKTSWIRSAVAHHPNTPIFALEPLINDDYSPVLWAIARRADTPPQFLERLLLRFTDTKNQDYEQICYAICDRREIPPNLLEFLMESNLQQVYQGIAAQANLPPTIIERLMAMSNESVLTTLARNHSLSAEFLTRLAQNSHPNICSAIANHPHITPEIWLQLANHAEVKVRQLVAANSNTPVNILEILASDTDQVVRANVANHQNLPVQILEQLAQDEEAFVRVVIANNPHSPETILTQLATDEKIEVRRAVALHPHTPAAIKQTLRDFVIQPNTQQATSTTLRGINRIYNPSSDDITTILAEYANSENAFVRLVTLLHPLTPPEILTQAAQSQSWLERYAVADNPATPAELRQQLAQDSNRIVRVAAKV